MGEVGFFYLVFIFLLGIPERDFAWLMDFFVWVERSLSSQLTLRMTSNSLSLFEVIGRRIYPHEDLWERI